MTFQSPLLLHIPIPDHNEQLLKEKTSLLQNLGFKTTIDLEKAFQNDKEEQKILDHILQVARITTMMDEELYFHSSELIQSNETERADRLSYISPINEFRTLKCIKRCLNEILSSLSALSNDDQTKYQSSKNSVGKMLQTVRNLCSNFCANEKQSSPHPVDKSEDAKMKNLFAWAHQQGVYIHPNLHYGNFEHTGNGFYAKAPIAQDEVIIKLPKKLVISVENALNSELKPIFEELLANNVHEDTILLIFTLYQRFNPKSLWKPYFDILQERIQIGLTLPLTALMTLDGLPLMFEIVETRELLRHSYEMAFPKLSQQYPELFPAHVFTDENFLWARSVFDSRGFHIDGWKNCLLPFVDMLNTSNYNQLESRVVRPNAGTASVPPPSPPHSSSSQQQFTFASEDSEFLQISAFADIPANTQVYINYGPYSNRELFLNYGFMTQDNPYDRCRLSFEIPFDSAELVLKKQALLEKYHLSTEHFLRKDKISPRLFASLRICMLDEEEVAAIDEEHFNPFEKITDRNETESLSTLLNILNELLDNIELNLTMNSESTEGSNEEEEHNNNNNNTTTLQDSQQSVQSVVEESLLQMTRQYCLLQREILENTKDRVEELSQAFFPAEEMND